MNLESIGEAVKVAQTGYLKIFFSGKTHKPACPLRAIVSEKDTWQKVVSDFLRRQLDRIAGGDPYRVRSSTEVVQVLEGGKVSASNGFSIDVEDLFYSVPHDALFAGVRERLEEYGEVRFQNSTGVTTVKFLDLLEFYLASTVICFREEFYLQKAGICIGSSVAPVLCEIFLASFDRRIEASLKETGIARIFRYVDDYLILLNVPTHCAADTLINQTLTAFGSLSRGLKFTHERAENDRLQFLDLRLIFTDAHVCWAYQPRSKKPLLNYDSAHSKLVKRGIVSLCMKSALEKSCAHNIGESFQSQIDRILSAGYPAHLVTGMSENLLKKIKNSDQAKTTEQKPVQE
ncbi:uncharacterized protein LOC144129451 [Amblyomma americanum]